MIEIHLKILSPLHMVKFVQYVSVGSTSQQVTIRYSYDLRRSFLGQNETHKLKSEFHCKTAVFLFVSGINHNGHRVLKII